MSLYVYSNGIHGIDFSSQWFEIYAGTPVLIGIAVIAAAVLLMRRVRKVNSK